MKILITGGTGFFGRAILRYFKSEYEKKGKLQFEEVLILTRNPEIFILQYGTLAKLPWLRILKGDVLFPETLPRELNINFVIHAASDSTTKNQLTALQTYKQIVDGTENILKYSIKNGIKRFLFVSSGGAYGPQPISLKKIPEDFNCIPDPLNPFNSYGIAKRAAEHLCSQYSFLFGLQFTIARCFAFVGEDLPRNAHFAIGNFIRDALESPNIIIKGNGKQIRSYMYQSDLANWLIEILLNSKSGSVFNVGSDEEISIYELARLIRDNLSPGKEIILENITGNEKDIRTRYVPDINKAKKELNLKVTVPLLDSIFASTKNLNN